MERKSKLSISLTLSIIAVLAISAFSAVVFAQPLPIGDAGYTQAENFDSNPTTGTAVTLGTVTGAVTLAFDGDLTTNVNFIYGATAAGYLQVTGFEKPSDVGGNDFAITFVDIKVDYRALATAASDDQYRIVAYVDPSPTPIILQDWVWGSDPLSGHYAMYPPGINAAAAVRTFSNVAEPNNGVWSWSDLASLRVRVEIQVVGTNQFQRIYVNEIWATAYSTPFPETLTMTVQPPIVMETAGGLFYVDIYLTGVTHAWGYQFVLAFDPAVLSPIEYMSYGPFISALPSEIGADYVAIAYKTYDGDPVGFTGNTPVARIYFAQIGAPGASCELPFRTDVTPPTVADIYGAQITITWTGGFYNAGPVPEFPLGLAVVMLLIPAFPVVYLWRMRKKERA